MSARERNDVYARRKAGASPEEGLASRLASSFRLSSASSIPLYHQLSLVLQRGIRDLGLEEGSRFPSEEMIAEAFAVSRPTANRAIQELISLGWLLRKRGRGTFVDRSSMAQLALLNQHLSFAEEMAEHPDYSSRVVLRQTLEATHTDAEALGVPDGAPLVWIRRLHTVGDRAVMVCDSKASADRFPGLGDAPLVDGSLYRTLAVNHGCVVSSAERCVEAAELLDGQVAELLGVELFAPILLLSGLAFADDHGAVEYMTAYVREGVSFKNLIRPGASPKPTREGACPRARMLEGDAC